MENSQNFWYESLNLLKWQRLAENLVGVSLGHGMLENAYARSWWRFLVSSEINVGQKRELSTDSCWHAG